MCISFSDNLLLWYKGKEYTYELAILLWKSGIDLKHENYTAGLFGIEVKQNLSYLLELKQKGLIDYVTETLGLDFGTVNGKVTLIEAKKDTDGGDTHGYFTFSNVVGMLIFTLGNHNWIQHCFYASCSVTNIFMILH